MQLYKRCQELCIQLQGAFQVFPENVCCHLILQFFSIIFAALGKDTLQSAWFVHVQGKEIKGEKEETLFSTNVKSLGLLAKFFICDEGGLV